ncbi:MAG: UvrABC system protein A [Phycisphaerae bacterium]|nr:UvrABC system protein A [Phycisphaerae bacterium]
MVSERTEAQRESSGDVPWLLVRGATHNNLKGIEAAIPLGRFVCITGVSGSGKSSLVNDVLHAALAAELNRAATPAGDFECIEVVGGGTAAAKARRHEGTEARRGEAAKRRSDEATERRRGRPSGEATERRSDAGVKRRSDAGASRRPIAAGRRVLPSVKAALDNVIAIDQAPIGRTPRSNPATYIKVFDLIRDLYTRLPDSKLRGYRPGRFSFNVSTGPKGGGRCEACEGNGANRIGMDFLADVWVTCPVCEGRRFGRETLQIHYKGRSIADVLAMDVQQAIEHFDAQPRIREMLQTLHDVGLDYLHLGQSSTTLSGGEAQRIKLARELVKRSTGRTIYVLDEPTTGLHFDDIRKLLDVLHGFVDAGNTVLVIEHNLDVIRTADWVIDLGPEGGDGGGRIVAEGTPEDIAANRVSATGQALRSGEASLRVERATAGRRKAPAVERGGAVATAALDAIMVRGARENNLKDLTVSFPRDAMTVCTGVSGSGKTSFAVDTVYTEGHRRYVESLSAYARQFVGQMRKPRVEHVEGLSPAICIEQKSAARSPRSTVGTITEIYDYMRVLWARIGTPHCPRCGIPIGSQTCDEIVDRVLGLAAGTPVIVLSPLTLGEGESYAAMFNRLRSSGYARVRIDGVIQETAMSTTIDTRRKHRVEVVVDRAVIRPRDRRRIAESVEHGLALGNGVVVVLEEAYETVAEAAGNGAGEGEPPAVTRHAARETTYSQRFACNRCGTSYTELGPQNFSFNSPLGWCETCEGLGVQRGAPASAIVARPSRGLLGGAIRGWESIGRDAAVRDMLTALCERLNVGVDTPLERWSDAQSAALMFGLPEWIDAPRSAMRRTGAAQVRFQWKGFFPAIDDATRNSWMLRHRLQHAVSDIPCITCRGGRLRADAAAARLADRTITEISQLPLTGAQRFFETLKLDATQRRVAGELLKEIHDRLRFLIDVGLDYVTLHRAAATLSGGESQRIRLAGQIGTGLSGVLYVLDEPTIGLHPRDTRRLIGALTRLRDLGNTLLLVEHDRDVIRSADRLLDFGPRAGRFGGELVWQGAAGEAEAAAARGDAADRSLTLGYLAGGRAVEIPQNRRPVGAAPLGAAAETPPMCGWMIVRGARHNNLRGIDVPIPLGRLSCVTGVSGSGKSSLVNDILAPALTNLLVGGAPPPGSHDAIEFVAPEATKPRSHEATKPRSHEATKGRRREPTIPIDKLINVDQAPIGTTPLSNPATYVGVYDWVRELFARLPESKVRGWTAQRFSFNRAGGRCETCEGYGQKLIEMHFLPDVWVECETCRGKRFTGETLEARYRGKSIADVLEMSVAEALGLFENVPKVRRLLATLADVGLDYLQLGQAAPTLSGGEAQRVKLAAELGKPNTGRTLYLLDEPTTGLHFDDVRKLLGVLHRLADLGNTVVVIEHNLDVIKNADWIVDLGPEAGDAGGRITAMGTPEEITGVRALAESAAAPAAFTSEAGQSHTAAALAPLLAAGPYALREVYDAAAHAAKELEIDRSRLDAGGQQTRMPWEVDGRRWHLEQRGSRSDAPRRWEPGALEYIEELVQKAGKFAPTSWNDRAHVEITAPQAEKWFLHALTGGEWLLECYFRVPRGTFRDDQLQRLLKLKTLDQRDDLPVYGNNARVAVRRRMDGPDAIAVYVHDRAEIDTPGFRRFVREAVSAYLALTRGDSACPKTP